jgi:hypothetical protein
MPSSFEKERACMDAIHNPPALRVLHGPISAAGIFIKQKLRQTMFKVLVVVYP